MCCHRLKDSAVTNSLAEDEDNSLYKKWSFPWRISSVNVTKSAKSLMENFTFCAVTVLESQHYFCKVCWISWRKLYYLITFLNNFLKLTGKLLYSFYFKITLAGVFLCQFYVIFYSSFFTEFFWVTTSSFVTVAIKVRLLRNIYSSNWKIIIFSTFFTNLTYRRTTTIP